MSGSRSGVIFSLRRSGAEGSRYRLGIGIGKLLRVVDQLASDILPAARLLKMATR